MPERQIPWVIGILFAIVLTGAFAFFGYVQDRIQNGYLLINTLSERVTKLEEDERLNQVVRSSYDNRLLQIERGSQNSATPR